MSQLSPWTTAAQAAEYFSSARVVAGNVFEVDCYARQPMGGGVAPSGTGVIHHFLVFGGFAADVLVQITAGPGIGDTYVTSPVTYSVGTPNAFVAFMQSYNLGTLAAVQNCNQYVNNLAATDKPDAFLVPNESVTFVLPAGKAVRIWDQVFAGISVTAAGQAVEQLPYRVLIDDMQP